MKEAAEVIEEAITGRHPAARGLWVSGADKRKNTHHNYSEFFLHTCEILSELLNIQRSRCVGNGTIALGNALGLNSYMCVCV